MLTRLYIEALLLDPDAPDQVQAALMAGEIDDDLASIAWLLVAALNSVPDTGHK